MPCVVLCIHSGVTLLCPAYKGAVGSYVFAYGVIALYPPEAGDCVGADCYQKVFFISSAACLVGGIAAFALDFYLKRLGQ